MGRALLARDTHEGAARGTGRDVWSRGKDAASRFATCARRATMRSPPADYGHSATSIHQHARRAASLLRLQADALGLPLYEVFIPAQCSNDDYEAAMGEAFATFWERGIET